MTFKALTKSFRRGTAASSPADPSLPARRATAGDAPAGPLASEATASGAPAAATASDATGTAVAAVALGAPAAEAATGLTGAGVKIGIISDSFDALGTAGADEADGALPSGVDVLKDDASGRDEGRAMAEVAHGVARGASILFSAAGGSVAGLASAVASLQAAGCSVICDDVAYADEPFFQGGDAAEDAIAAFTAAGGAYFAAASNAGPDSAVQASFAGMSASLPGIGAVTAMNFGTAAAPRATDTLELTAGQPTAVDLQWAQPWATIDGAGAAYSLAVAIYDPSGALVKSFDADRVGADPVQSGSFTPAVSGAYTVAVYANGGTDPGGTFKIVADDDCSAAASFAGAGGGSVFGHAADPEVIAVGAVAARFTPAYGGTPVSEGFSAAGGGEDLFGDTGAALATPKHLRGVAVSGPDGIATSLPTSDLDPFYGTSCATPAVAAVGALMKQANPSLDAGEIEAMLRATALPFGDAAQSGAGLVQAPAAVALAEESGTAIHDDFFGDGLSAPLWQDRDGDALVYAPGSGPGSAPSSLNPPAGGGWSAAATGDFSGVPGQCDILWQKADGQLSVALTDGAATSAFASLGDPGAGWTVAGTGDFGGGAGSDVLLTDAAGDLDMLTMDGTAVASRTRIDGPGAGWSVAGIGDFDGDGRSDVLWQDGSGDLALWMMRGASVASDLQVPADPGWTVVGTGDLAGDGRADALLQNAAGDLQFLSLGSSGAASFSALSGGPGAGWRAAGVGAFDGSGRDGILFEDAGGAAMVATPHHGRLGAGTAVATPGAGWTASLS